MTSRLGQNILLTSDRAFGRSLTQCKLQRRRNDTDGKLLLQRQGVTVCCSYPEVKLRSNHISMLHLSKHLPLHNEHRSKVIEMAATYDIQQYHCNRAFQNM